MSLDVCLGAKPVEGSLRWMSVRFNSPWVAFPRRATGRLARTAGAFAVLGLVLSSACGVDSEPLFSGATPVEGVAGRRGNLPAYPPFGGLPGTGGSEGSGLGPGISLGSEVVGVAQQQEKADAGTPDSGTPSSDASAACVRDSDCEDGNLCTFDDCIEGSCQHIPADRGVACGSSTENACTSADSCDGAGHCLSNDAPEETPCGRTDNRCAADTCDGAGACVPHDLPAGTACGTSSGCGQPTCSSRAVCEAHDTANGSACPGGSCSVGACVQGQRVGCPQQVATSVPFQMNWSSAGRPDLFRGDCESNNTPDSAVVFVVPAAGRYRFEATGSPDSVLALVRGACGQGNAAELTCNDDISEGTNRASRIELELTANQTLTVYVSEFGNNSDGSGTLTITAR